ncbi:unnamed protein product, partial [Clonostachys rhizophaga]
LPVFISASLILLYAGTFALEQSSRPGRAIIRSRRAASAKRASVLKVRASPAKAKAPAKAKTPGNPKALTKAKPNAPKSANKAKTPVKAPVCKVSGNKGKKTKRANILPTGYYKANILNYGDYSTCDLRGNSITLPCDPLYPCTDNLKHFGCQALGPSSRTARYGLVATF